MRDDITRRCSTGLSGNPNNRKEASILAKRISPEKRARKRARYAANVSARAEDSPAEPSSRASSSASKYDASHLRPTRSNPDPGLLAQSWEAWQSLGPLGSGERRRPLALTKVWVHPSHPVRKPDWMRRDAA